MKRTIVLALLILANSLFAADKTTLETETQASAEAEQAKKRNKKHAKRKSKHADRDIIGQLRAGELSAADLAQALTLGAGRIGSTIDLDPEHSYSSPYMRNKAGSGVVTLSYGSRTWAYDFDRNTVTETTLNGHTQ